MKEIEVAGTMDPRSSSPQRRQRLKAEQSMVAYMHLVSAIADRLYRRLPPNVEKDDLFQVGLVGLYEAFLRFDGRRGVSFGSFASHRIEGAMLDELRARDTLSRRQRAVFRRIHVRAQALEHALGRAPRAGEIARSLGMPLSEVHRVVDEAGAARLCETEGSADFLDDIELEHAEPDWVARLAGVDNDPVRSIEARQQLAMLRVAIDDLTEQESQIMDMLYTRDMPLKDVAVEVGLSQSRVFQIELAAIAKLAGCVRQR
jgi:RNA polymerase sigma factor for flagellar operon FliA